MKYPLASPKTCGVITFNPSMLQLVTLIFPIMSAPSISHLLYQLDIVHKMSFLMILQFQVILLLIYFVKLFRYLLYLIHKEPSDIFSDETNSKSVTEES